MTGSACTCACETGPNSKFGAANMCYLEPSVSCRWRTGASARADHESSLPCADAAPLPGDTSRRVRVLWQKSARLSRSGCHAPARAHYDHAFPTPAPSRRSSVFEAACTIQRRVTNKVAPNVPLLPSTTSRSPGVNEASETAPAATLSGTYTAAASPSGVAEARTRDVDEVGRAHVRCSGKLQTCQCACASAVSSGLLPCKSVMFAD